jgi:hypothetical protein
VERDGHFWVENLPLGSGATSLSISATDAWKQHFYNKPCRKSQHVCSIGECGSQFALAVDHESRRGVGAANYTVRVNGILAENHGNGTWFASSVPVNPGGTASFTVNAYPPGQDLQPSAALTVKASVDKPFRLYVDHHKLYNDA